MTDFDPDITRRGFAWSAISALSAAGSPGVVNIAGAASHPLPSPALRINTSRCDKPGTGRK